MSEERKGGQAEGAGGFRFLFLFLFVCFRKRLLEREAWSSGQEREECWCTLFAPPGCSNTTAEDRTRRFTGLHLEADLYKNVLYSS